MTFNVNVPNASQSPGLFPAQQNTNNTRLKTIINAEHVFNDTAAGNDGVHRQMTCIARADPSSLPAGTNGVYYIKTVGSTALPYYYDGTSVFALAPFRAYAKFTVVATVVTINTSFNVTSITRTGTGLYTVVFTNAMPSANYLINVSGTRATGGLCVASPATGALPLNNLGLVFGALDSTAEDPSVGMFMIFGA